MTLITVLLDTDIQLFFYYCSYSLVGTVSFDMTGQNTNSVSQLAFCYIVSPLMMRLMQNVFTCIKLSQQARIWFALESISLSNDRTQFHYIFSDERVQFNLKHFKWQHNSISSILFGTNGLNTKLGLEILPWERLAGRLKSSHCGSTVLEKYCSTVSSCTCSILGGIHCNMKLSEPLDSKVYLTV